MKNKNFISSFVLLTSICGFLIAIPVVQAADFYKCTYSVTGGNTTKWTTQTWCNNLGGTSDSANKTTCAESVLPDANGVCGGTAETSGTQVTPFSNGNLPPYVPLEPLPGFIQTGNADFSKYINQMFKVVIAVGAIIAVGMLVFSGVVYMVSGAIGTKSAALKRIHATLWGLLLLIASWLLLYTINPRLVGQNADGTITTIVDTSITSQVLPPKGSKVLYANDPDWDAKYTELCSVGSTPEISDKGTDSKGAWVTYTCQ